MMIDLKKKGNIFYKILYQDNSSQKSNAEILDYLTGKE